MRLTKNFNIVIDKIKNEELKKDIFLLEESIFNKKFENIGILAGKILEATFILAYEIDAINLNDKIRIYNAKYENSIISDAMHMIRKTRNTDAHFELHKEKIDFTNSLYIIKSVSLLLQNAYLGIERGFYFNPDPYIDIKEIELKIDKEEVNKYDDDVINSSELTINKTKFSNWFKKENVIFHIPFYQRKYTWDLDNLKTLIEDIKLRTIDRNMHYFGVVATSKVISKHQADKIERKIIDGQQRITTSLLFYRAAYDVIKNKDEKEIKILNEIFENSFKGRYINDSTKIAANEEIQSILNGTFRRNNANWRYGKNYNYFYDLFESYSWNQLYEMIAIFEAKFEIAEITYEIDAKREMDIFENMNSKGTELQEWDLIRNQIFNSFTKKTEETMSDRKKVSLMDKHFLEDFNSNLKKSDIELAKFFTELNYLEIAKSKDMKWVSFKRFPTYNNYKNINKDLSINSLEEYKKLLTKFNSFSTAFKAILIKKPEYISEQLSIVYNRIINLSSKQQTFPPILMLFEKYAKWNEITEDWSIINEKYFIEMIILLDTTLIRLEVVKGFGNSLRIQMLEIAKMIYKDSTIKEIKSYIENKTELFVNDSEFKSRLSSTMKYRLAGPMLIELNNFLIDKNGSGVNVKISKPSIEHVMPQNNSKWEEILKKQSPKKWSTLYDETLNMIGNFYVLPKKLNSKVSNSIFVEKKHDLLSIKTPMIAGDKTLEIMSLSNISEWTFDVIKERTEKIVAVLTKYVYKW